MRYKIRWNVNRVDNRRMNFFEKLPTTGVAPQGPPMLSLRVSRSASDLNLSKTNLTLDRTGTNARLILEQNLFFCTNTETRTGWASSFSASTCSLRDLKLDWAGKICLTVAIATWSFCCNAFSWWKFITQFFRRRIEDADRFKSSNIYRHKLWFTLKESSDRSFHSCLFFFFFQKTDINTKCWSTVNRSFSKFWTPARR